ncbi:MAG: type II secretion system protein [Succinivibrionaceae bacterium]|nr:type II secretion system protein [Succinivibrionaceae bacterium]
MKRQSGFTLIELVVVIVILGILAATAAPKFMNLQGDARVSALNGLSGAVKSAINLSYSKAILKGVENQKSGKVCADNSSPCALEVILTYGKPAGTESGILRAMDIESEEFTESSSKDWVYFNIAATKKTPAILYIMQSGAASINKDNMNVNGTKDSSLCALKYTEATSVTENPKVEVLGKGC